MLVLRRTAKDSGQTLEDARLFGLRRLDGDLAADDQRVLLDEVALWRIEFLLTDHRMSPAIAQLEDVLVLWKDSLITLIQRIPTLSLIDTQALGVLDPELVEQVDVLALAHVDDLQEHGRVLIVLSLALRWDVDQLTLDSLVVERERAAAEDHLLVGIVELGTFAELRDAPFGAVERAVLDLLDDRHC